jgi:thioredoxin 1
MPPWRSARGRGAACYNRAFARAKTTQANHVHRATERVAKLEGTVASEKILILNEDNFDDEINQKAGPILVDFWAAWCAPCKIIAPSLEELAEEMAGRAHVAKVDVDSNGDLANRFGIMSIPTLVVFKDGRVVDQLIGAAPKPQIQQLLEKHLA